MPDSTQSAGMPDGDANPDDIANIVAEFYRIHHALTDSDFYEHREWRIVYTHRPRFFEFYPGYTDDDTDPLAYFYGDANFRNDANPDSNCGNAEPDTRSDAAGW